MPLRKQSFIAMSQDIFVFPDYRRDNPYQELMYGALRGPFVVRYGDVSSALEHLRRAGPAGRTTLHLHWEDAVYRRERSARRARAACRDFLTALETFVDLGGRVLWTVHNETSHEAPYADLHRELATELAALSDRIHFHTVRSAARFVRNRIVDPEKVVVAPHGNYVTAYTRLPEPSGQTQARRALGLPLDGLCVLLFGRLSAYKGAAELIETVEALRDPRLFLLIAGRQIDPLDRLLGRLTSSVRDRIHVIDGFVPTHTTPTVLAAADFVALPYQRSLTSGTMMLALSMGRPVIAPNDDHPMETIEDGATGFLYRRDAAGGLRHALERALAAPDPASMRREALDAAHRYDWRTTANVLAGAYHELAALPRARRRPIDADHGDTLPRPSQNGRRAVVSRSS